jgi:hypothetical protein
MAEVMFSQDSFINSIVPKKLAGWQKVFVILSETKDLGDNRDSSLSFRMTMPCSLSFRHPEVLVGTRNLMQYFDKYYHGISLPAGLPAVGGQAGRLVLATQRWAHKMSK